LHASGETQVESVGSLTLERVSLSVCTTFGGQEANAVLKADAKLLAEQQHAELRASEERNGELIKELGTMLGMLKAGQLTVE
jgi:hypothetical protein